MSSFDLPEPGLYRTTTALPGSEAAIPADALVFVGQKPDGGGRFVVRPGQNRQNRWYWGEPTIPLRSPTWGNTLRRLPQEGFYNLPEVLTLEGGGRWVENAIVQLGYNEQGQGILFVAERREGDAANALYFSDRGVKIEDRLLDRLRWAPILPVASTK